MHILLAEDNPTSQKLANIQLHKLGYHPDVVSNGAQALHKVVSQPGHYHLVFMDCQMPEMDGYVLTKNVKGDARFDGVPVVMHSSLSSEANRAMGKAVGVDSYVAKFDAEVLADTLRPLLER